MDPWSIAIAIVHLAAIGFHPIMIPVILFLDLGMPESWWENFASKNTTWDVTAFWLPLLAIVTYWVNGLFLLLVDVLVPLDILRKFKIQPDKSFDKQKLFKVCKNLLIGQIFVIIPYGYACALLGKYTPISMQMTSKLPSGRQMLLETVAVILFDEVTFFYSHWALHSKVFGINLYTMIHKTHHEFTSPHGLAASYCHPIEMLISNVGPLTFGGALVGANCFTAMIWIPCAVLGTQFHHCGYRWPWLNPLEHNPDFHDFHHLKFTSNYGLLGWLDRLHGTDKQWQEELQRRGRKPTHPLSKALTGSIVISALGSIMGHFFL